MRCIEYVLVPPPLTPTHEQQLLVEGQGCSQFLAHGSHQWDGVALGSSLPILCNVPPSSGGRGSLPLFQPPTLSETLGRSVHPPTWDGHLRLPILASPHSALPVAAVLLSHQPTNMGGEERRRKTVGAALSGSAGLSESSSRVPPCPTSANRTPPLTHVCHC